MMTPRLPKLALTLVLRPELCCDLPLSLLLLLLLLLQATPHTRHLLQTVSTAHGRALWAAATQVRGSLTAAAQLRRNACKQPRTSDPTTGACLNPGAGATAVDADM